MWFLVVAMLVILVLAGLVVLYVAYPHRGEDVPYAGWLGRLLHRGVQNAPTLHNTAEGPTPDADRDADSLTLDFASQDRDSQDRDSLDRASLDRASWGREGVDRGR
jgi:hypothetical protein